MAKTGQDQVAVIETAEVVCINCARTCAHLLQNRTTGKQELRQFPGDTGLTVRPRALICGRCRGRAIVDLPDLEAPSYAVAGRRQFRSLLSA